MLEPSPHVQYSTSCVELDFLVIYNFHSMLQLCVFVFLGYLSRWLGGITVRASDLRSSGCGFDFRLGRYQAT